MNSCLIRSALQSDEAAVFALVNQLHATITVDERRFSEAFLRVLQGPEHCCLVWEQEGRVVGYACGYKHVALYAAQAVAYLDEIVVAEGWRGAGGGRQLLAAFERWAEAEGCVLVGLATGGASGFYEKHGYRSRAGYYKKTLAPALPER